ncbi:hypothetical protein, partial [Streptomyces sp. FH025]|uniref:hypothetical protein n=1 Tax=Streptomyces sp. FH025 TaxID=2815937 RepID=UPI001AC06DF0|nr:beta-ketoacyl synthase [Streptomyces sp. FH025]
DQLHVEEASSDAGVLAELDRLKAALRPALADDGAPQQIAARLRELLDLCEEASGRDSAAPADDVDLEAATDEELFALFDELE